MIREKFKRSGHVILTTPVLGLALDIFYPHIKLGDFCFSRSVDMIADVHIENGWYDPDHTPFKGVLSSKS